MSLQITEIDNEPEWPNLNELNMSRNALSTWKQVAKLGKLAELQYLSLIGCHLKDVVSSEGLFPSLKALQLSENSISDWQSVSNLGSLSSLQDLRFRSNPVLETEDGETCRQLLIASVASLKVLNGTEIAKTERYGAELDYWKKFGMDFLKCEDKKAFSKRHPRYERFLKMFGEPEEGELKAAEAAATATLASNVLEVTVEAPMANIEMTRKLPSGLTLHKLKAMLQRMVKAKGRELEVSYVGKEDGLQVEMDNDLRDLNFYGVNNGDKIVVKWR